MECGPPKRADSRNDWPWPQRSSCAGEAKRRVPSAATDTGPIIVTLDHDQLCHGLL